MKKLLVCMILLCVSGLAYATTPISVDAFISPDSVTIQHLENFRVTVVDEINNFQGGLIQKNTVSGDAIQVGSRLEQFRVEAFNDWVYYGLIMPTSATLSSTTVSGVGYVHGNRIVKDDTPHTYTASKWTWVELDPEGTYRYVEGIIGNTDPATANVNSMRIARVSTDATAVIAIRDDRIMAISLDNAQADPYRIGLEVRSNLVTTDSIVIDPGICYWGNVRRVKRTVTTLGLNTVGDWVAGEGVLNNTMGFVVMNNAGSLKLSTTAPTLHDMAGTTEGVKYYSNVAGTYYRAIAWFFMSNTWDGSVKINPWEYGNFGADMPFAIRRHVSPDTANTTSKSWVEVPDTLVNFYSTGGPVSITAQAMGWSTTQYYSFNMTVEYDGVDIESCRTGNSSTGTTSDEGGGGAGLFTTYVTADVVQGNHTARIKYNQQNGYLAKLRQANIVVEGR